MQTTWIDFQDLHAMKPHGVGTIRRSGRKYSCQRIRYVPSGVNLERSSVSLMKPGDDNDFVADPHSMQAICVCRNHLYKRVRWAISVNKRGVFPVFYFHLYHY